ncbi:MAG TPA: DUF1295 domain-containing protein [Candidatus Saccharimonadales bacterium]|nr:DUF1295 domain-containing protein [Candidatus Saccharimonadales bacterium]
MLSWLLVANAIAILVVMTGAFLVAKKRQRLDTVDSAWGMAFAVAAAVSAGYEFNLRTVLLLVLVDIWAVRLTAHLLDRSRHSKEDPRYKELSKKWKGNFWLRAYFSIFVVQGVLVWIISLPVAMAVGKSTGSAALFTILGVAVWLKGFVIEALADRQLALFRKGGKNKNEVLQTGLWRYSRHPNYYGEITQWFGIGLIACAAHNGWVGLAGPLVLTLTIIFISGIPPIEKRRAADLKYQEYKRQTSVLIPWRPKQ